MARYFQITTPEGVSNLKLDSQGCATLPVKAKNVTAASVDAHASAVSLPATSPPSGAVQNGWIKIEPTDQHFNKDEEKVFVVRVAVPKKPAPKPGTYQFKVDIATVAIPDQGEQTSVFTFSVAPPPPNGGGKFPLWLIPVILVVLIGLGVGIYFAVRGGGGIAVPDLGDKTLTEATALLNDVKLALDPNYDTTEKAPGKSDKIVDQTPKPGEKAKEGATVHVTVGAHMVTVPRVLGLDYQAAQKKLTDLNLATGDTTTAPNPGFNGGYVWDQTPVEGASVKSGTAVNVKVTPKTVPLQSMNGKLLGEAVTALQGANLNVGVLTGDTTGRIVSQSPPADGRNVEVGTKIDLVFPNTGVCQRIPSLCVIRGPLVNRMVLEQSRNPLLLKRVTP